jgi:small subunit ribosomal protein S5
MAMQQADASELPVEETVVKIYRCAKVVRGVRRFSFGALVAVGDRAGHVGMGYGKANEVPSAVEKAMKAARRALTSVVLVGTTIPHEVHGHFGASHVKLVPASPGTGVIACSPVRAVLELAGIRDVLSKAMGSTNPKNLVKATFNALAQLRSRETVEALRGVSLAAAEK